MNAQNSTGNKSFSEGDEISSLNKFGLYRDVFEKDGCGIGLVARPDAQQSRVVLEQSLQILGNLVHRGAFGADGKTSDGAGILTQIPVAFFLDLPEFKGRLTPGEFAVGMMFLPKEERERKSQETAFERYADEFGFKTIGWRTVPTDSSRLGAQARLNEPVVRQVILETATCDSATRAAKLLQLRKKSEAELRTQGQAHGQTRDLEALAVSSQFYVASLSYETIVYKGLMAPGDLGAYFPDLQNPLFRSAFALVHSRFSTNTLPAWELAHPFRYICHNGEINTVRGNTNWMKAREAMRPELAPFIPSGLSDSASFDHAVELLVQTGRSVPEAMMMLIPQAWESDESLAPEVRTFYSFHAPRMEPWDGPAAVCFASGRYVGASLDRSGLRPCRYAILDDGTLVLASETGALRIPETRIQKRGRLGPGQMILIDLERHEIVENDTIKMQIAGSRPYQKDLESERCRLVDLAPSPRSSRQIPLKPSEFDSIRERLAMFDYTDEEVRMVLTPMFLDGEEVTSSMGNDTPLAVLSDRPQLLFKYFRQLFAQVTNPPIDPIREKLVMSLTTYLGARPTPFDSTASDRRLIQLSQPILKRDEYVALISSAAVAADHASRSASAVESAWTSRGFRTRVLDTVFSLAGDEKEMERSLEHLCESAVKAAEDGIDVLVLSDRRTSSDSAAIPILLAVSALHHALIRAGLRTRLSLVADTAEARDVHHFACLIGFGADAVHPSLAFDLAEILQEEGRFPTDLTIEDATDRFVDAVGKGLLTILSKMGISTLQAYCGAQIFEILGLSNAVVERYFSGTVSRIGGLELHEIARETKLRHQRGLEQLSSSRRSATERSVGLPSSGAIHYRAGGELHSWNPETISKLQIATRSNQFQTFQEFSAEADRAGRGTLRGLLRLKPVGPAIALDEVEPAANIVRRFTTGAMSFGSLSQEAHETLAIAMNRIGGKSNSGEGGEGAERFATLPNGDSKNSAIKQVASGRFGVTTHYLVNARELQIKIAQGAKPGEGGKLPGHKVDETIAVLRHSTPGVTLISPPPHHDIYSIEDLAQLIFDLKRANPVAAVSVKLVSGPGVGTIAAGVAKAKADKILISGDNGGTGASGLSSIQYAGSPWELGLAEAHQTLVLQGLRGGVRLETDGQLKTGRDVVIAALLGADEFGFSTAPLIVEGCVMMRKCHLNTCPVGVATQDPELRKKFTGQAEHVINFFFFVAEELRRLMSELGFRTVSEMIGRTECLEFSPSADLWKARALDLRPLLARPSCVIPGVPTVRRSSSPDARSIPPSELDSLLLSRCQSIIEDVARAAADREGIVLRLPIQNTDRSCGTLLSSEIARRHGATGLPPNTIVLDFHGTAGQSFGAFLAPGITLRLQGDANDYVGKGLSGGRIIISAPEGRPESGHDPSSHIIAGNACLYGATSGEVYIAGVVGERFAVRNSGVTAVVEGTGDHGCEYMTRGRVVVLGRTGRNFAAGMSGGLAYVLDEDGRFRDRCNKSGLEIVPLSAAVDEDFLQATLHRHALETGSAKARRLLNDWARTLRRFVVVIPLEYKQALLKMQSCSPGLAAIAPSSAGAALHVGAQMSTDARVEVAFHG